MVGKCDSVEAMSISDATSKHCAGACPLCPLAHFALIISMKIGNKGSIRVDACYTIYSYCGSSEMLKSFLFNFMEIITYQ